MKWGKEFTKQIQWFARKYAFGDNELYKDLVQVGWIGLFKAEQQYNSANKQGASFKTYAFSRIRWEMLHYLRDFKIHIEIDYIDWQEEQPIADLRPRHDQLCDRSDYIRYLLSCLTPGDRYVIEQVYIEGHTREAVAKSLGVSKMSTTRTVKRALNQLRGQLTAGSSTIG